MDKEIIECEYCHTLITENDTICPKCGANCSNVIKKYKEEKQKKEQEKIEKVTNFQKAIFSSFEKKTKIRSIFCNFHIFYSSSYYGNNFHKN